MVCLFLLYLVNRDYYYGARYYNPKTSIWLSVDPMADIYPGWSPYNYCMQNPVNLVDPTGMFTGDPNCDDDDGRGSWFSRAWQTVKSWFGSPDKGYSEVKPLAQVYGESQNMFTIHTPLDQADNPNHISNGINSHIMPSLGVSQDLPIGNTTNGGLALPQDFGDWNSPGSDGRIWIGCMSCHGDNGAYRNIAYNSPSRYAGIFIATTVPVVGGIGGRIDPFALRGGYGVFGRNGLRVRNYRIDALYAYKQMGSGEGTIISVKQMKTGGAIWRWDYGRIHGTDEFMMHSTIRFYYRGVKYGSTAQRTWYPSSFKAPFFKPIKK